MAIVKDMHAKYRPVSRGKFFRRLAASVASAPKMERPLSPFSWKQRSGGRSSSSDFEENYVFEEIWFDEVQVKERIQQL